MSDNKDLIEGPDGASVSANNRSEPWKPEIVEVIYGLLYRDDLAIAPLVAAIEDLQEEKGPEFRMQVLPFPNP